MLPDPIGALPGWLLAGVVLGGLLALGFAAVFAVGIRVFPDRTTGTAGPEGGERRRRAEVRRYLASIDEPYLEDHVVAGRPAAFYLPDRDVAITFDARDYFRISRSGVRAVLLEYEVPGAGLGGRLPFEPPETGRGGGSGRAAGGDRWAGSASRRRVRAADTTESSADGAFAALGLPAGAPEEAVREAYRERVKDVHPDRGGDVETFRRLREAYTVARERAE